MFSVIIPVYNKADTLSETVNSVMSQTVGDWEIIIVDDGSTDDIESVLANFKSDARVRVIRQKNAGVSVARNAGIAIARYEYLAFLDADDEWMPDHLEELSSMISAEPGAGLYDTAYRVALPNGGSMENQPYFLEKGIFRVNDLFGYMEKLGGKQFVNTVASCVSAKAVARCGGFQAGVRNGEDTDFFLRVAAYYDVVLSSRVTAIYHRERSTATEHGFFNYDWYFQSREAGLLADVSIPKEKREYIRRSMDRFRIHKCRHYLLDGNRAMARKTFALVKKEPELRKIRLLTLGMMLMPASVLRVIYKKKKQWEPE